MSPQTPTHPSLANAEPRVDCFWKLQKNRNVVCFALCQNPSPRMEPDTYYICYYYPHIINQEINIS